jgi:hypothetical protein
MVYGDFTIEEVELRFDLQLQAVSLTRLREENRW